MEKQIYFAGGCFWGLQKYFGLIGGVVATEVGYANGITNCPTYEEVCSGDTGHAETVKVTYETDLVSLDYLLEMFYNVIDPTSINRQGNDAGSQYRTGVYYTDEDDRAVIIASIRRLQKLYDKPVAVEVMQLTNYHHAEDYHQDYLAKNPGGYCHIGPREFERAKRGKEE